MAMSVTSATFDDAVDPPPFGRIENITSLITWAIRPCWASTAIFVLKNKSVKEEIEVQQNCEPILDALCQLIIILLLVLFLLLLK